ncbi:hypothetical protein, partial [Hafnia paralvei]|uniref:hypothetical protein n=1 Tax=Hafnia paralvei TaxID=546367 RepID=UPI001D0E67B7
SEKRLPARNLFTLALFTESFDRPVSERTSLCAFDLPPSSLMAVLSCISFNTRRQSNIVLSFESLSVGRESRHDRDVVTEFGAPWMGDTKP